MQFQPFFADDLDVIERAWAACGMAGQPGNLLGGGLRALKISSRRGWPGFFELEEVAD